MLRDLDLHPNYRSGRDAILDDFYIPCLQESVSYDRAVGYFSSSLLHVVAIAYSDFVQRGGHMRLVCSPALTIDDFEAMKTGMESGRRAQDLVRRELELLLSDPSSLSATRLLATLVGLDVLEVSIASLREGRGIFHDKVGIFQDESGRRVSFVGSANETWAAWGMNHESFETFCSWRDESDLLRTRRHADEFERLWNGFEPSVLVEGLDHVTRERLLDVADDDLNRAIDHVRSPRREAEMERTLMPHQTAVLESWRQQGYRGIVAFATGAGKTVTALAAIKEWTASGRPALILVPGRELHRQWIAEIAQEIPTATPLKCGAGAGVASWHELLAAYSTAAQADTAPRIILSTNATFCSAEFQSRLKAGQHLLVVADEMHRLGSKANLVGLNQTAAGATLGLSATYSRQFDEAGTATLLAWFGSVLEPIIGLAEAIMFGLLVPYDYRLHTVRLDDDELEKYTKLTDRIRTMMAIEGEGTELTDNLKMLLIARARILKNARTKVGATLDILRDNYRAGERWLVYCDDTTQLTSVVEGGLHQNLPVMEFHSGMTGDRGPVLESLRRHGGIVVAIRCLDEGVDIPTCDCALVVASSSTSREYIQRRGRVLRAAPGKSQATVHDLLLVDADEGILARSEAIRALEFARLARNPAARARIGYHLALSHDIELPAELVIDDEEEESGLS